MIPINSSTSTAIFRWRPACWLRVTGDDAFTFLQGQFTNDLRAMESGPAVYGLWLTVKGKVLADSFVARDRRSAGAFWIGSYFSAAAVIRERLESHVIADDVVIEDETPAWEGVSVFGPGAEAGLEPLPEAGVVFRGRRGQESAVEWVFPSAHAEAVRNHFLDTPEIDPETIARLRIAAGVPAIPADLGPADLPNEGGLEADAISYTKGCYLGQEVMARLKSMGQVRRRLLRVRGAGDAVPAVPAPVFGGGRQVGELRSAARDGEGGWIGLAMLSLLHVNATTALALAPEAPAALQLIDRV